MIERSFEEDKGGKELGFGDLGVSKKYLSPWK